MESTSAATFTIDVTSPTVTVDKGGTQADPTGDTPVVFDVEFSELVTGFDAGDVDTSASTVGVGTPTVTPVDGDSYTVSVPVSGNGDVTVTLGAGAAQDAATNGSEASTNLDNTVMVIDTAEPTVTVNQATGQADPDHRLAGGVRRGVQRARHGPRRL